MRAARVRWSVRLPWSTAVALRRLVQIDAPGHPGDICGRALAHLLDQPEAVILAMLDQVGRCRLDNPLDRTQIVSMRMDATLLLRLDAWQAAHPERAVSWLADAAIRSYLHVCTSIAAEQEGVCGLRLRRYRRLPALVVVVDGPHAA